MEAITLAQLLEAVHGTLLGDFRDENVIVQRVDTDSRTIHPGSLFIPLVGERFDGHAYINAALEGGALGCLTARERESYRPDRFYIKVASTQRALRDLAAWYKARFPIPFIAVTGSVGKTTTKDMIAAVLSTRYRVLKTEGNYNNNIGLPLTLLRLDRSCEICVLEMGMDRPGEIDYLGEIVQPDVGVITNIGDAHIERLGSRENIFRAKCELLPHIRPGGLVVLNGDDPTAGIPPGPHPGARRLLRPGGGPGVPGPPAGGGRGQPHPLPDDHPPDGPAGGDPCPGGAHDLPRPHRRRHRGAVRAHPGPDRGGHPPLRPHPDADEYPATGGMGS